GGEKVRRVVVVVADEEAAKDGGERTADRSGGGYGGPRELVQDDGEGEQDEDIFDQEGVRAEQREQRDGQQRHQDRVLRIRLAARTLGDIPCVRFRPSVELVTQIEVVIPHDGDGRCGVVGAVPYEERVRLVEEVEPWPDDGEQHHDDQAPGHCPVS